MRKEKLISHITHLEEKHRAVDENITAMESSGHFDDTELNALKKYRLILKDEITDMQRMADEMSK
jgi:hypothetical protein